jgi:large conductance mechanosensitive channel
MLMKKLFEEFKSFIMKGNALDLAIGVIIGSAFGSVVNGVVKRPAHAAAWFIVRQRKLLRPLYPAERKAVELAPQTTLAAAKEQGAVVLAYGNFITTILNFVIIASAYFCW